MKQILLFALYILYSVAMGQNKKPICKPDTTYSDRVNVKANDYDPNGDKVLMKRFLNKDFTSRVTKISIYKVDTGTFTLDTSGLLYIEWMPNFYGQVNLTYYVNDGKAGAGTTGKITCIRRNKFTKEIPTTMVMTLIPDVDCVFKGSDTQYFCQVVEFGDTADAYISQVNLENQCEPLTSGLEQYWLIFTDVTAPKAMAITKEIYYFIKENGCKK